MYGILGEDASDAETLKVLVRRLADNPRLPVIAKGYGGCGRMLSDGARDLQFFKKRRLTHFIVCHDADGPDPKPKKDLVMRQIVQPSGSAEDCCIVIPVQELEAWILADIECASHIFTSWHPGPVQNPEGIVKPKETLERLSEDRRRKRRYKHALHNEKIAWHLDLAKVEEKCPAFRILVAFVKKTAPTR